MGNLHFTNMAVCKDTMFTKIDKYAFADDTTLQSVQLSEKLLVIEWCAFDGCTKLKYIEIPSSVRYVAHRAFHNCINLIQITFPEQFDVIQGSSLFGCINLRRIIFKNKKSTCITPLFKLHNSIGDGFVSCITNPNLNIHVFNNSDIFLDTEFIKFDRFFYFEIGRAKFVMKMRRTDSYFGHISVDICKTVQTMLELADARLIKNILPIEIIYIIVNHVFNVYISNIKTFPNFKI